jgi:hypothetical protein
VSQKSLLGHETGLPIGQNNKAESIRLGHGHDCRWASAERCQMAT